MNENTELLIAPVEIPLAVEPSPAQKADSTSLAESEKPKERADTEAEQAEKTPEKDIPIDEETAEDKNEKEEVEKTSPEDEQIAELEAELEKLTETSGGLEIDQQAELDDQKLKTDEKHDPLADFEYKVDLKALLLRTLLIIMRAIYLLIFHPNQKITGADLGLPENSPDDTTSELPEDEHNEQGEHAKSWDKVFKTVNSKNVKGTITDVMGTALDAVNKYLPMRLQKIDREKNKAKKGGFMEMFKKVTGINFKPKRLLSPTTPSLRA